MGLNGSEQTEIVLLLEKEQSFHVHMLEEYFWE
jgi:hypothetical protein